MRVGRFPPRTARAKGVVSVGRGERLTLRRDELDAPTPAVTLTREDPEPALPTPTVTFVCDAPATGVPTPTGETLGRGSVGSDDSGEGVFRLTPTPAAGGIGVLVRAIGLQGE